MKKENKILIITFFILISLFLISRPGFLNITGRFLASSKVIYEKASVSIQVIDNSSEEETPDTPTGGSGGTGAVVKEKVSNFTVDKNLIKIVLKQGETQKEFLEIKNTGETSLDITIDLGSLKNIIIFSGGVSKYSFKLEPGEIQNVQLIFSIAKDYEPDVYPGEIIIKGGGLQTVVTTIIEIESEELLFDIDLEILEKFRKVEVGGELFAEVSMYNPKGSGLIDVKIDYIIMDLERNIIIKEHETLAIETRTSFIKDFIIPSSLETGSYILCTRVNYGGSIASSSSLFEVVEKPHIETPAQTEKDFGVLYLVIAIIIIFSVLMIYQYIELKKLTKSIRKVRTKDLIKNKKRVYKRGE